MMKKVAALGLVLLLIVNFILFSMHKISISLFWLIIISAALISYFGYGKGNLYKHKKK